MSHRYTSVDIPVDGGHLHVGVWEPVGERTADVLLIHGVTSSHLVFPFVAQQLPGVRVIAPDLRGRARSNSVAGPSGMAAHARDAVAVLDHFDISSVVTAGHSMGAFVSVVLAHQYPSRVDRLVLIDGGIPLDVPPGLEPATIVSMILGPTAERLSLRFDSVAEYLEYWADHPAFIEAWTPELRAYFEYDLVPDGPALRPATSVNVTADDTADLVDGTALLDALGALRHPARFVTVPCGLQGGPPGLYDQGYLDRVLPEFPAVTHERIDGFNHYTIVISPAGGRAVADIIAAEIAASNTDGVRA